MSQMHDFMDKGMNDILTEQTLFDYKCWKEKKET